MNDEYLDIVDETGEYTGRQALKRIAHENGWYHHTTHVWIYNKKGEILIAQRSLQKLIHPGLWDVSSAGHVDAGESIITAALRELKEELGLELNAESLFPIGVFRHENDYEDGAIKDYEFHNSFIVEWNGRVESLALQEGEVDRVKWVTDHEFLQLLENSKSNSHFIKSNEDYYLKVLNSIRTQLKSKSP